MSLFLILIHRSVLRRAHLLYSNFAWELHGGVDVKWSACLCRSCIDVIVVRVIVSRGIEPFSPMEIDSAATSH
jgi:hypothetical protein